jgi:hypothetical protein
MHSFTRAKFCFAAAVLMCVNPDWVAPLKAQRSENRNFSHQAKDRKPTPQSASSASTGLNEHRATEAITGVVVSQSKDKTIKILTKNGKEMSLSVTKETKCKKPGSDEESDCSLPKGSVIQITSYGFAQPVEVGGPGLVAIKVFLQSACKEDFCPKNQCKRKCGATKCVCSD